jgi:hypothetical protein
MRQRSAPRIPDANSGASAVSIVAVTINADPLAAKQWRISIRSGAAGAVT